MMTSSAHWSRDAHVGTAYDDDYDYTNPNYRERYRTCSPTTRRRLITKVERRLGELRVNSESMAEKLGRAEKELHELKLDDGGVRRSSSRPRFDDVSDDSVLSDDVRGRRHNRHEDREALRREIARLREDLRLLRRQTSPSGRDYVTTDDGLVGRRHAPHTTDYGGHVGYNYNQYDSTVNGHHQYADAYRPAPQYGNYQYNNNTTVGDDLRHLRRSKTSFDDLDYNDYRYVAKPSAYCNGSGLRSSFTRPIPTQHNRSTYMTSSPSYGNYRWMDGLDTTGMRTFKPYGPADVSIGDVIKFRRTGGRMDLGRVMYVGHLPGKSEPIIGVEMDNCTGNHDGLHNGFRYFQCKPNRGLFVPFDHVILAWTSRT